MKRKIKRENSHNQTVIQFLKFGIVGVINTLINLVVLFMLTEMFGIYYITSAVIAFFAAVTNSFIMNKLWTFQETMNHKIKSKYAKFIIISLIALVVNLIILYTLVEFFNLWYMFAQIIGVISNLLINFLGNKLWTFKNLDE